MTKVKEGTAFLKALEILKTEIRRLYGLLSVKELVSNPELVLEIEILERMLSRKGVV